MKRFGSTFLLVTFLILASCGGGGGGGSSSSVVPSSSSAGSGTDSGTDSGGSTGTSSNIDPSNYVLPNKVEISHFGRNYILKADINSFKLVNPLGVNQYQRFPGLNYKYFFNDRNVNFSLDSDFAFYRKGGSYRNNDKQKLTRIFINPKISYAYFNKNYFLETSFLMNYLFKEIDESNKSEFLSTLKINNLFNQTYNAYEIDAWSGHSITPAEPLNFEIGVTYEF